MSISSDRLQVIIDKLLLFHKYKGTKMPAKILNMSIEDYAASLVTITKKMYKRNSLPIDFAYTNGEDAENELFLIIKCVDPDISFNAYMDLLTNSKYYYDGFVNNLETDSGYGASSVSIHSVTKRASNRNSYLIDRIDKTIKDSNIKITINKKPIVLNKSNTDAHVFLISDMELGQYIAPDDIGPGISYNIEKAYAQLEQLQTEMACAYSNDPAKECYVLVLGDIVRGLNAAGAWNPSYINEHILEQAVHGSKILTSLIHQASELYPLVNVVMLIGNHGRAGKYREEHYKANWDAVTYKFVESACKELENVVFDLSSTWYSVLNIANLKALAMHGEGKIVKGAKALDNIRGPLNDWLLSTNIDVKGVDLVLLGHHHQALYYQGKVIVNGSWMGPDLYASKDLGVANQASQVFFSVIGNKITCFKEMFLTGVI